MIRTLVLLVGLLPPAYCQIAGDWQGVLEYPDKRLVLILHLKGVDADLTATADSPLQGMFQMSLDYVSFHDDELRFRITQWGVHFAGKLDGGVIRGAFSQTGLPHLPLVLKRVETGSARIPERLTGDWSGVVNGPAGDVRIVLRISTTAAMLDIPDQAIAGLPAGAFVVDGDELRFDLGQLFASYRGKLVGQEIRGAFSQNGYELSLTLKNTREQKK